VLALAACQVLQRCLPAEEVRSADDAASGLSRTHASINDAGSGCGGGGGASQSPVRKTLCAALRSHWLQWHCWAAAAAAIAFLPTVLLANSAPGLGASELRRYCAPSAAAAAVQEPATYGASLARGARSSALVHWVVSIGRHVVGGSATYLTQLACLLACMRLCDEHDPHAWDWRRFEPAIFAALDACQRLLALLLQHALPLSTWGLAWGLPHGGGLLATLLLAAFRQYRHFKTTSSETTTTSHGTRTQIAT